MKKRNGFVSNSSSSSFVITNKTNKDLTFVDLIAENPHFVRGHEWYTYTLEDVLNVAKNNGTIIPANSSDVFEFEDHGGSMLDDVLHYALEYDGESESFSWSDRERH